MSGWWANSFEGLSAIRKCKRKVEQIGNKSIINFSSNFTKTEPTLYAKSKWSRVRLLYEKHTNDLNSHTSSHSFTIIAHWLLFRFKWKLFYFIHKPKQIECGFGTLTTRFVSIWYGINIWIICLLEQKHARLHAYYRTKYGSGIYYRCPNPNIHAFYWCCWKPCWTWL